MEKKFDSEPIVPNCLMSLWGLYPFIVEESYMMGSNVSRSKGSIDKSDIHPSRETRFSLDEPLTALLLPNYHCVFGFWFSVENISKSGVLVHSIFDSLSPLKNGDLVSVTLDMHSKFFERPIQMELRVAREASEVCAPLKKTEKNALDSKSAKSSPMKSLLAQSFGLSIERINEKDLHFFNRGLRNLEEKLKLEESFAKAAS